MLHFSLNRSDKLRLSVLDLTHTDLATEEDKKYQLDYWASLFKSTTWEELKMLAQNNEYIEQASDEYYVAAGPPVRRGESHPSGQTEPPCY